MLDLNTDEDLLYAQWYNGQRAVMAVLRNLMRSGWERTINGLMMEGKNGPIVARPMKEEGYAEYTGIGVWRINPCNFSQ